MEKNFLTYYKSPIGMVEITSDLSSITSVKILDDSESFSESETIPDVLKECAKQLDEYFKGERKTFDLPLSLNGTDFQNKVWENLQSIPYGKTVSYKELANMCEKPNADRAVGSANGKNPHWIIIPCHRVINVNGKLGGYAGGLWRKEWLLKHEAQNTILLSF